MTNSTPPTSLKIQEEFERGNTARTNLVGQSEALYLFLMFMTAGIKHFSFSTTKPRVSGKLSPIFQPFRPPSNDRPDTRISRSFSLKAARKLTCSAAPRPSVRFLTPRLPAALPAVCRTLFLDGRLPALRVRHRARKLDLCANRSRGISFLPTGLTPMQSPC